MLHAKNNKTAQALATCIKLAPRPTARKKLFFGKNGQPTSSVISENL